MSNGLAKTFPTIARWARSWDAGKWLLFPGIIYLLANYIWLGLGMILAAR